jgi:hypothetical protein
MRRLTFIICCTLALAMSASAEMRRSDVLLTDSGAFYRIDSVTVSDFNEANPDNPVEASSATILVLTIQGNESSQVPVPATLSGGYNIEPSLAYDPDDDRIYLFWQRKPSPSTSELILTSFKDGIWSNETIFDNGIWRLRFNLRIRITHYMTATDEEDNVVRERAVVAHAVWWEQHGQQESARYAMLNLSGGDVVGLTIRDMSELSSLTEPLAPRELPEDYDKSSFRTPFILDVPGNGSVDIMYADWYTNHYEIVNVRPVLDEKNGVLHIPLGVTTGVMDAPTIRVRDIDNGLMAMSAPAAGGGTDMLIYSADDEAVDYVIYRNGTWSESKKILFSDKVTLNESVQALRRNIWRN